ALGLGENAVEETVAIALDGFLDPPDVDHIAADADDHALPPAEPLLLLLGCLLGHGPSRDPFRDCLAHAPDSLRQAQKHGLANQKLADMQLTDWRKRAELRGGVEVEPVAGVDFDPSLARKPGSLREPLEFALSRGGVTRKPGFAIGACVKFDSRCL